MTIEELKQWAARFNRIPIRRIKVKLSGSDINTLEFLLRDYLGYVEKERTKLIDTQEERGETFYTDMELWSVEDNIKLTREYLKRLERIYKRFRAKYPPTL